MPSAPFPTFEHERLQSLLSLRILDTPSTDTFDELVRVASKMMSTPIAAISLVAEKRQWFKAICGLPGMFETPRDLAFCGYTILDSDHAFVIEDAISDIRVADNKLVVGSPNIRSYAGAPLLASNGLPIGALCVIDTKPRTFSKYELGKLLSMSRMVSKSLQLHGAMHKLRQRGQIKQSLEGAARNRLPE